jgi:hypothetical protein
VISIVSSRRWRVVNACVVQPSPGVAMTSSGDGLFRQGEPVWVMEEGGSQRAANYLGESETTAWFGGKVTVMVVYEDTRAAAAVDADRVIPRER